MASAADRRTPDGKAFHVGGLHLPPALQRHRRWTGVGMGRADQHALGIQAGRCGSLGRNGSAQFPAEPNQIEAEQQHALTGVILQSERTREQLVMDLGGAPLEIDAVPGELDAERWRYRDLGKTRTSHECRKALLYSDHAPRRVIP